MNVAIDIRCLQDKQLTGVGEYTLNLLRHLFVLDKSNRYYLFTNSSKKITLPEFNFPNVKICRFHFPNKLLNLSLWLFKRPRLDLLIEKKFGEPINLFFFPNLNFLSTKCPYVITCHDLSFEFFPEFFSKKQRLWHRLINPTKTFGQAKSVICVSKNTATDINSKIQAPNNKQELNSKSQTLNFKNSQYSHNSRIRIDVIYPGIGEEFKKIEGYEPRLQKISQKYKLPKNFILFLGTIEPRKNIETLILAFEKFKASYQRDFHLVIAGKHAWWAKKILAQISNSPAKNYISVINYVEPADKVYLYNLAKVFVFPSYYEGFGFPALEALACGAPTIISHTSSLIEVCGESAIAVDPYNVNDLAEALKVTLSENLAPPNTNYSEKFNWEKAARQTLKVLTDIYK